LIRIAVASGKGGTGKTTIATSLALSINSPDVLFMDCDVEGPNAHFYLEPDIQQREEVGILLPQIDESRCTYCRRCAEVCQFHAIVVIGSQTLILPELCHGCGSCTLVCPENAISEKLDVMGVLEIGPSLSGFPFARGVMNVGEPMAVPVIRQLKKWATNEVQNGAIIIDTPPGTSCPVVESLKDVDFVLLVTEPTPFGLHDLKLAFQMVEELGMPSGVVINRDGIGNSPIEEFCSEHGLPILMRIPFSRQFAEVLAQGQPLVNAFPEYQPVFRDMHQRIQALIAEPEEAVR
jgi:MinD superfamily P-loop ATPase